MVRNIKNPKKAKRKVKGSKKGDTSSSSSGPSMPPKVWQPGVDKLEEGEELHFDIVRDTLGLVRTEFPHTVYFVRCRDSGRKSCLELSWNI
ncbi:hypothetical protein ACFXTO_026975 [Malus domestica]